MKVFLTIWILAVLIQEVIPNTLVRLPRHAEKNLSLVHTEYEAKYEQKGKHGNGSFSSVSGKQEIVHDNCAENWNSFAEKCASLIKDLVASLANAVSSKPGDATNLQLHIKNTFRHFDNTNNCTCLNHTGKTLSDLNLSPLFKNITINTVEPGTKTEVTNGSGAKQVKCGGKSQPCDGGDGYDTKEDKNLTPQSNGVRDGFDQNQSREKCQFLQEPYSKYKNDPPAENVAKVKMFDEESAEEPKQQNRALADAEDLEMNPENAEGSSDQSTNNSRRQIKYPENSIKPPTMSKNLGEPDFNPLVDDLEHFSSSPAHPKDARYPFLVTARPNLQSAEPFESSTVDLNPPSLSGIPSENDSLYPPEYKPSNALNSQENYSAPTAVLPQSSTLKSSDLPSSASYVLPSPSNGNSSPNNNFMPSAAQMAAEPHSSLYNDEDPEEVLPLNNPESHQNPTSLPMNPIINSNNQSPALISGKPFNESNNSHPAILFPAKPENDKPYAQSPETLPAEPVTDSEALNPVFISAKQLENDHKVMPSVIEKLINNSESSGQPIVIFPESSLLENRADAEVTIPVKPLGSQQNISSSMILPEESVMGSDISKLGFIPVEQMESGPDAMSSPITKPSQQPTIILPEKPKTEGSTSNSSQIVPDNYKSNMNSPATIPALPIPSAHSNGFPQELGLPKTAKLESSGLIPENLAGNNYNSEPPLFIQNKKQTEAPAKEQLPLVTPKMHDLNKTSSPSSSPGSTVPGLTSAILSPEDILPIAANGKPLLEEQTTIKTPVYKPSPAGLSPSSSPGSAVPGLTSAILSPEDILPIAGNGKPLLNEQSTTERDYTTGDSLDHTTSMIKSIFKVTEVPNQQSGISTEKQLSDKLNQPSISDSDMLSHFTPIAPESTLPQKSGEEVLNNPMKSHQYPQQSMREEIFTTPLPLYPEKIVTIIPAIGQPVHSWPLVDAEDPENYELQKQDFTVTQKPTTSNISEDQQSQPKVAGGAPQNEKLVSTPRAAPEIEATTPVIIYPVKSLPISPQSPEQLRQESSHPMLVNSDLSHGDQNPEVQPFLFTTPAPISLIKPIQVGSMTTEQQNGKTSSLIQPTATAAPTTESSNVQHPQDIVQPNGIPSQLLRPNFNDHPQGSVDSNFVPASTTISDTTPVTSTKPQQKSMIPTLKPAPYPEEKQDSLLIHPTTFQTTSEDPTPSQVNVPGLLTHTTSVPQDSDETMPIAPSSSPKTTSIYEHDDDDEEDCCSSESYTEEEITDPKQYKESACKNLEEARKELKAIFDKIKKKLKCGRKAPQAITSS